MNLQKLFEAQFELDERIIEKKGLQGVDLLPNLIIALQVELGKCAQEWRGFKLWSSRQEPVTEDLRVVDFKGNGEAIIETYNPLLEQYVDCLNFTLSIGLHLYNEVVSADLYGFRRTNILDQFKTLFHYSTMLSGDYCYWRFFEYLIGLGEMFGFTWDQIEQVYFEKNEKNHSLLEDGY